jgi:hypothetical protein
VQPVGGYQGIGSPLQGQGACGRGLAAAGPLQGQAASQGTGRQGVDPVQGQDARQGAGGRGRQGPTRGLRDIARARIACQTRVRGRIGPSRTRIGTAGGRRGVARACAGLQGLRGSRIDGEGARIEGQQP